MTTTNGTTTKTTSVSSSSSSPPLSSKALFYMFLLALQFGMQPALTRRYTPTNVSRSTIVMMQEIMKFFIGLVMISSSGSLRSSLQQWSISSWVAVAIVPAALYSVQNMCSLLSYQNLDALTYNVLNQTKTLSAALCVWLLLGKKQSSLQVFALLILLLSALVMENIISIDSIIGIINNILRSGSNSENSNTGKKESDETTTSSWDSNHYIYGVVPVLIASFLSGLAGAISQKNLQGQGGRNAYFFTMELCIGSIIFLSISLLMSNDGKQIYDNGFFHNWTIETFIPIITMSFGGLLVGLVTKHAGSVRKGFALIFGIFISGLLQEFSFFSSSTNNTSSSGSSGLSKEQIIGGLLAAISLWIHATNPPKVSASISTRKTKEE